LEAGRRRDLRNLVRFAAGEAEVERDRFTDGGDLAVQGGVKGGGGGAAEPEGCEPAQQAEGGFLPGRACPGCIGCRAGSVHPHAARVHSACIRV